MSVARELVSWLPDLLGCSDDTDPATLAGDLDGLLANLRVVLTPALESLRRGEPVGEAFGTVETGEPLTGIGF